MGVNFFPTEMTKYCFLFGHSSILNSPSPAWHSKRFQDEGIDGVYLNFPMGSDLDLHSFVGAAKRNMNFLGGNLTTPFKETLLSRSDLHLSQDVQKLGAANTISRLPSGEFLLSNTDIFGIEFSVQRLLPRGTHYDAVIFGAGGSAKTLESYFKRESHCQRSVTLSRRPIVGVTTKKASAKIIRAQVSNFLSATHISQTLKSPHLLLVNTIPIKNNQNTIPLEFWKVLNSPPSTNKCIYFFDLIYEDTFLVQEFRSQGVSVMNGEIMWQIQAEKSFEIWKKSLELWNQSESIIPGSL